MARIRAWALFLVCIGVQIRCHLQGGCVTESEYREKVREALVDGLLGFEGAAYNEETLRAMQDKVIEVWPPRDPIQWVESVKIENGAFHYKLTPEATELLREQGWEEIAAAQVAGKRGAGDPENIEDRL
jgi:hypothetical protein